MNESTSRRRLTSLQNTNIIPKPIPKTAQGEVDQQEHIVKTNKQDVSQKGRKSQRWTLKQNKLYIKFLEQHAHLFRYKSVRRVRQIFILLSDKMKGSRTPAQCKSHHQKMRKATQKGTIKQILNYMKQKHIYKQPMMRERQRDEEIDNHLGSNEYKITYSEGQINFQIRIDLNLDFVQIW